MLESYFKNSESLSFPNTFIENPSLTIIHVFSSRPRYQNRAGCAVHDAARPQRCGPTLRDQYDQFCFYSLRIAQDHLCRSSLHRCLARREQTAFGENSIGSRKDALGLDAPSQFFGFAQARSKIGLLLFIPTRTHLKEQTLCV